MTTLSSKERYALFLESDFWKELSRRKRLIVGRCERCGCRNNLQSHHRFYRENWFDTILSDLEVLCRRCHENHHQKKAFPAGSTSRTRRQARRKAHMARFREMLQRKKKLQTKARRLKLLSM